MVRWRLCIAIHARHPSRGKHRGGLGCHARMGEDGYMGLAAEALEATRMMREGVAKIEGLKVLGQLNSTVCT